jgi:uncharacterized protein (TIGR01777 family)
MRVVAITGSTGLVGRALVRAISARYEVRPLRRGVDWYADGSAPSAEALEGVDALIHLAGEGIAGRRWSAEQKARIGDSRRLGTGGLARAMASMVRPPSLMISASAVGIYGNRDDEMLDEASSPGEGFLPETCLQWETAADLAREAGVRVVHLRIGVVLSRHGGALAKMLTPFQLGLGGRIGNGRQYMSWIGRGDLIRSVEFCLEHPTLEGPLNLVAPQPVENREFTRALGRALRRPTVFPLPAFVVRLLMGEMGQALLLEGNRVLPTRLLEAGFCFRQPTLEEGIAAALVEPDAGEGV